MSTIVNELNTLDDHNITDLMQNRRFFRALLMEYTTVCELIKHRLDFKELTPTWVLGRIVSYELDQEEKRLTHGSGSSSKKNNIALKAKKSSKKIVSSSEESEDSSSSDEESNSNDKLALFVKRFNKKFGSKFGNKLKHQGESSSSKFRKSACRKKSDMAKRACFNCGKKCHFIAECPEKADEDKEKKGFKKHSHKKSHDRYKKKDWKKDSAHKKGKYYSRAHVGESLHSGHRLGKAYASGGREWVMDSGCTNHMTGEKKMFSSLELGPQHHENITFGDNGKGKSTVVEIFKKFARRAQNEFEVSIKGVRSDNGTKFKNLMMEEFLDEFGVKHEFSAPHVSQQNGVVERKNPINTACHASNRLYLHRLLKKTPYELISNRKPDVSYFRVFGSKCYILNKKNRRAKFDSKCDEGFFFGYPSNAHAYRVFNNTTKVVEIAKDVQFDESNGSQEEQLPMSVDIEEISGNIQKMAIGDIRLEEVKQSESGINNEEGASQAEEPNQTGTSTPAEEHTTASNEAQPSTAGGEVHHSKICKRIQKDHPVDQILGDIRRVEPKTTDEALSDPDWVMAMHEELNNFKRNQVWTLVERPRQNVIGTKWVFRNKQDEDGIVMRNKARLVAQGFTQVEGSSSKDAMDAAAMASGEIPYRPQVVHIDPILLAAFNEETLPETLMSHVEGLIVGKIQSEEWEQNRNLRVARRLEEEERAEKERVEKEKAEAALKKKEEKKFAELQKKKANRAKSDARKKAAEKSNEVQGGNEEVDREKTEYEKTRDAAREIRREIGLKARNDPAAPSDTEESQDLPQTVLSKKITMTCQASEIAEVKKTAKEFGLRIKVPAGRSTSTSSSMAVEAIPLTKVPQKKKAIDTLVPDTSNVKLTSLLDKQEQAASSPTVLSEHTAQQEGDETDADAPVPTPEVRVKKAVKKKSVAPSEPSDPSSSSDEEKEEEKKEEEKEKEPTQEYDDLMEIDRLPEDLLKTAPKKK
ncbi:uncharacterized protein LOC106866719 [Brachypodium distachyon]|uniref:uncharacterized protein LOC106866719 n=1 Tax=Brachypodium distachyon TaxID=15368 RepID=UPI00071D03E6|nr:uncharacterized protein LOC106866719 [Brachypodium distachyon]|eukprot:XP_014757872.1 uncharacterized protein LOC106866719 [Brachypodium distachyon]